jgi:predicted Zn-dependent protease
LSSQDVGALFLERHFTAEAEQTFRVATEIAPSSSEAVFRYVNLLVDQRRYEEAIPVVENALLGKPKDSKFRDLLGQVQRMAGR